MRRARRERGASGLSATEARRAHRQTRWAAERSEQTSDDDVAAGLARLELHRRVLELVQALDDPYRATLVLRFVEERTPAEIAGLESSDTHSAVLVTSAPRRSAATPTEAVAATTATLDVRVVDGDSGEPLPSIGLVLVPFSRANPFLHSERLNTDEAGRAQFVGLTPGRCTVGTSLGVGEALELGRGEVRELVLRAPSVWRLTGKVVDRDGRLCCGSWSEMSRFRPRWCRAHSMCRMESSCGGACTCPRGNTSCARSVGRASDPRRW